MDKDKDCTHYLVPHDVLQNWRENSALSSVDRPLDKNLAKRILDLENTVKEGEGEEGEGVRALNDRVLRRLGEFLNYKKLRDNIRPTPTAQTAPPPPVSPSSDVYSEDKVLASVPASYRTKAKKILERWSRDSAVAYDKDTGTVSVKGRELRGSNITDLLRDVVSRTKKPARPSGFEPLRDYTAEAKIPTTLFGNPAWRRGVIAPIVDSSSTDSTLTESPSNVKDKKRIFESDETDDEYSDAREDGVVDVGGLWEDVP